MQEIVHSIQDTIQLYGIADVIQSIPGTGNAGYEEVLGASVKIRSLILSQYKQHLLKQIEERCKQTVRFDEQDAINIIKGEL